MKDDPVPRGDADPYTHNFLDPIFTERQCNQIILLAHAQGFHQASVGWGEGVVNEGMRTNTVTHIPILSSTRWIYETVQAAVNWVNRDIYRFNLLGCEGIQVNRYLPTEGIGQHYAWHHDDLIAPPETREQRKLSFVCLLNSKEEFTGGLLESADHTVGRQTDETCMLRKTGQVSVFPSWLHHRVTPVTQGFRYSMVTWFSGPRWV